MEKQLNEWSSAYHAANSDVSKCREALKLIGSARKRLIKTKKPPQWLLESLYDAYRQVQYLVASLTQRRNDFLPAKLEINEPCDNPDERIE